MSKLNYNNRIEIYNKIKNGIQMLQKLIFEEKKIYLSPILVGFNGEVISYNTSKSPNLDKINDMLDQEWQY